MDPESHFNHLFHLLRVEREEDRKQYEDKIRGRSLEDRKREGVTWFPVIVSRSYLSTGEKWALQLERPQSKQGKSYFQTGSSVSVFLNESRKRLSTSGIISRLSEKYMTVVLNREDPPDWIDDGKLGVDLLFDESTYDEMEKTVKKLSKVKEGRLKELIDIFCGNNPPSFAPEVELNHPELNESQNKALALINAANDIGLVHGPPGTGKTTTLVEAIREAASKEKQVLVCASSNAAVDLLAERLTAQDIHVLRLGHPARVTEEVLSTTLDARIASHNDSKLLKDLRRKSEEMRDMGKKYKRNFGQSERQQRRFLLDEARKIKEEALALESYMINDELDRAQVIACTLVGSSSNYLYNRSFKTLFIDESSQALEPASWIPILKSNRVIMAGDHFQLPPTIKSIQAGKEGLSETLFERCIQKYQAGVMLEIQYRMQDHIMQFSNDYFYKGKLKTGQVIKERKQLFTKSVEFIDTAGCGFEEKVNPETLSTFNEEEADFLIRRMELALEEFPEKFRYGTIGVIAPYKAQVEILRSRIETCAWYHELKNRISINTVDAFQGQEKDFIFISLVRSNPTGEIGFLGDIRRMNVAMTRARHLLMLIGDSATLSNHQFFNELISFYQAKGFYRSAFEFNLA